MTTRKNAPKFVACPVCLSTYLAHVEEEVLLPALHNVVEVAFFLPPEVAALEGKLCPGSHPVTYEVPEELKLCPS